MSQLNLHLTSITSFNIHLSTFTDEVTKVEGLSDLTTIIDLRNGGARKSHERACS